jgi:hypothetical protein
VVAAAAASNVILLGSHLLRIGPADVMGFAGAAPEIINGRLAQLGFLAAVGAELATGKPTWAQFSSASGPVFVTAAVFIVASLIPIFKVCILLVGLIRAGVAALPDLLAPAQHHFCCTAAVPGVMQHSRTSSYLLHPRFMLYCAQGVKNDESFGPLTPKAELTNGRFAMLGFAALLIVEGIKGSALF